MAYPPTKQRRALSHVGGATRATGNPDEAARLAHALDVPTSLEAEDLAREHVHGFHAYAARMHPVTARRVVAAFSSPGDRVLDPFCGSGTVLVEARLAGREAWGVDANPLAVRLARLKTRAHSPADSARLLELAAAVASTAETRRKAKAGATHRYGPDDVALFAPHVLLELDGLRAGLDALLDKTKASPAAADVRELELVLSAILMKMSRKTADTSDRTAERRLAAGYPTRLFVRKAEELTRAFAAVAPALEAAPPVRVLEGDARLLDSVPDASIALVATSPPYGGTYDYASQHVARLRWLRLSPEAFERVEIGARRRLEPMGAQAGIRAWEVELGAALFAMARVLSPTGRVVVLLADSVIARTPVRALDLVTRLAPRSGLAVVAASSQTRPVVHATPQRSATPREEHLILLARAAARR